MGEGGTGMNTNHFAILKNKEVVGVIGLINMCEEKRECGFYYQLIRRFWNQGYGKEAAKGVLKYGLQNMGIKIVIADAVEENVASIKILRELGFEEIGISKDAFEENGHLHDVINFKYIV